MGERPDRIQAGRRLAVEKSKNLPDWFASHSPRNDSTCAEGPWHEWVDLAVQILAADTGVTADAVRRRLLLGERVDRIERRWAGDCCIIDGQEEWGAEALYLWLTRDLEESP